MPLAKSYVGFFDKRNGVFIQFVSSLSCHVHQQFNNHACVAKSYDSDMVGPSNLNAGETASVVAFDRANTFKLAWCSRADGNWVFVIIANDGGNVPSSSFHGISSTRTASRLRKMRLDM